MANSREQRRSRPSSSGRLNCSDAILGTSKFSPMTNFTSGRSSSSGTANRTHHPRALKPDLQSPLTMTDLRAYEASDFRRKSRKKPTQLLHRRFDADLWYL